MQESAPGQNAGGVQPKKNKKLNLSKKNILIFISVILAIGVLVGTYSVGYSNGAKNQKASDEKKQNAATAASNPALPDLLKNRWSIVGTVEEVSANSITVKNNKGLIQTATVNGSTSITEKSAKKTTIDAVKKGGSVIVIGSKDDNGKITASMIRIKT